MPPTPEYAALPGARGARLLAAVELQDHLNLVGNDLDRLQRLLADACITLLASFQEAHAAFGAAEAQSAPAATRSAIAEARRRLGAAVVALQFQDMASQLIEHSQRRLRSCADQIARDAMPDDDDGPAAVEEAPPHPNPVTQDEMDAGSVELF
ncbi:MAG TPA: hypothetical protein PLG77_15225 [Burkholderiaceae bacterium]|nr:hypothetical protein [Burkholderiaceae bacterium]